MRCGALVLPGTSTIPVYYHATLLHQANGLPMKPNPKERKANCRLNRFGDAAGPCTVPGWVAAGMAESSPAVIKGPPPFDVKPADDEQRNTRLSETTGVCMRFLVPLIFVRIRAQERLLKNLAAPGAGSLRGVGSSLILCQILTAAPTHTAVVTVVITT